MKIIFFLIETFHEIWSNRNFFLFVNKMFLLLLLFLHKQKTCRILEVCLEIHYA